MKKSKIEGSLWSITYRGRCPDGWPVVLAEMFMIGHVPRPPEEIENFPITLGGGYAVTHSWISPPPRQLSQDTKAIVRRKRLKRRLDKKYPMFADQFFSGEIERKKNYYNGITDQAIQEDYDQALSEITTRYNERIARPGVLIVFAQEPEGAKAKAAENLAIMAKAREILAVKRKTTKGNKL